MRKSLYRKLKRLYKEQRKFGALALKNEHDSFKVFTTSLLVGLPLVESLYNSYCTGKKNPYIKQFDDMGIVRTHLSSSDVAEPTVQLGQFIIATDWNKFMFETFSGVTILVCVPPIQDPVTHEPRLIPLYGRISSSTISGSYGWFNPLSATGPWQDEIEPILDRLFIELKIFYRRFKGHISGKLPVNDPSYARLESDANQQIKMYHESFIRQFQTIEPEGE